MWGRAQNRLFKNVVLVAGYTGAHEVNKRIAYADNRRENDELQKIKNNSIRSIQIDLSNKHYAYKLCLMDALMVNGSVTSLDLIGNLDQQSIEKLVNVIRNNNSITVLKLSRCNLGDIGARKIINALKSNSSIAELDISYNNIGEGGGRDIASMLRQNNTLVTLNISGNIININGAQAIIDALKSNTSLMKINLHNTNINDAIVKKIPGNRNGWDERDKHGYFTIDRERDIREAEAKRVTEEATAKKALEEAEIQAKKQMHERVDKLEKEPKKIENHYPNAKNVINSGGNVSDSTVGDITNNYKCTILMVKDIKYDNPLLNNKELFNYAVNKLGVDAALSLGYYLDSALIEESIHNEDYDLVLAGLISLGN